MELRGLPPNRGPLSLRGVLGGEWEEASNHTMTLILGESVCGVEGSPSTWGALVTKGGTWG